MPDDRVAAPESTDEQLAACVAGGDMAALSVLYDRYAHPVYAMAAHLLGAQEAEDVVQDAFVRLCRHAGQYDHRRGQFAPWFMAIARHEVMARLRRVTRDRRLSVVWDVNDIIAATPDSTVEIEESVWLKERSDLVLGALGSLPPEQRRVLTLAYFGGFTQAAIADIVGVPIGTVKKRVRLGLQKLKRAIVVDDMPSVKTSLPGFNGLPRTTGGEAGVLDDERQ